MSPPRLSAHGTPCTVPSPSPMSISTRWFAFPTGFEHPSPLHLTRLTHEYLRKLLSSRRTCQTRWGWQISEKTGRTDQANHLDFRHHGRTARNPFFGRAFGHRVHALRSPTRPESIITHTPDLNSLSADSSNDLFGLEIGSPPESIATPETIPGEPRLWTLRSALDARGSRCLA